VHIDGVLTLPVGADLSGVGACITALQGMGKVESVAVAGLCVLATAGKVPMKVQAKMDAAEREKATRPTGASDEQLCAFLRACRREYVQVCRSMWLTIAVKQALPHLHPCLSYPSPKPHPKQRGGPAVGGFFDNPSNAGMEDALAGFEERVRGSRDTAATITDIEAAWGVFGGGEHRLGELRGGGTGGSGSGSGSGSEADRDQDQGDSARRRDRSGEPAKRDSSPPSHTRRCVVIIGAGISGLAAARALIKHQKQVEDDRQEPLEVIVLEGRDRVGGRICTEHFEDGSAVDMGAAWIHGASKSNPLTALAKECNAELTRTEWEEGTYFGVAHDGGATLLGEEELRQTEVLYNTTRQLYANAQRRAHEEGEAVPDQSVWALLQSLRSRKGALKSGVQALPERQRMLLLNRWREEADYEYVQHDGTIAVRRSRHQCSATQHSMIAVPYKCSMEYDFLTALFSSAMRPQWRS
jgi:hypothetical protein